MMSEIRQFYFGNTTINAKSIPKMIDLMSDSVFGLGIDDSVKKHAAASTAKTYYYRYVVFLMKKPFFYYNKFDNLKKNNNKVFGELDFKFFQNALQSIFAGWG